MKKQNCLFCGAPATLFCDGHIGYPPNEDQPKCISPFEPYTCDAPMCQHCATLKSTMHICRRRGGCIVETIDHCPACVANLPENHRRIIHSADQAAVIRAAHWVSSPTDFQKWDRLITGGGQQCLDL